MTFTLTEEARLKLKVLLEEGIRVTQAVKDLKEGLKEVVKALATEMDVKPAMLNKAIRVAFKQSIDEEKNSVDQIGEILHATGFE